ncbi:hypothetical protein YC2023_074141 [Brassica napus]
MTEILLHPYNTTLGRRENLKFTPQPRASVYAALSIYYASSTTHCSSLQNINKKPTENKR